MCCLFCRQNLVDAKPSDLKDQHVGEAATRMTQLMELGKGKVQLAGPICLPYLYLLLDLIINSSQSSYSWVLVVVLAFVISLLAARI